MKDDLSAAVVRLIVFVVVCLLGTFALLVIYAQLRFDRGSTYRAAFTDVSGLEVGDFVRVAGVEVGTVTNVVITEENTASVEFSADDAVVLTDGSRAAIRYDNLIGDRYLELLEGAGGTRKLQPGGTIALDHTAPALDLDALIGGFRPLFRALDPDQVNKLSGQLIQAFQGQGDTIGSFLTQTAALTSTLADRDQLIGDVVVNLNTVLGSLSGQGDQFAKAVESLSTLVAGLEGRKTDLANGLSYANTAAASISDLLVAAREPFKNTVAQTDRVATTILNDKDYFDDFLNTLPDSYRILGRQALTGDYFSFYICDLVLKVNGKGGQPVYIKVAGQDTGRCTPQ
ncbi:mammalian cell entry protein [Mycobacterium vulneris]|uniref:MCE family protein n=1 Tax=Mycolicibacterium septicum DSM 44393 TaxID=1341646 RepID=A0A7X6MU18_9MYCO|nr:MULTISPECIES: MCE family protein [Mycolicibacterium]MBX8690359.1 MCE family protein [Mycobacterium sp. 20091114027_K0903767]MCP3811405.1 MCE family protein [Mycobacteriaceae bacterium Msp059]OCB47893.1 mammalian cell entry protein [Mycolicibacterium vulneris]NKZ14915.1 MCE family protein [Mycolicibacterium septicum DSM 44393]OBK07190.1 mammalian cell entry protein [Mycolicibacterium fortuitum]